MDNKVTELGHSLAEHLASQQPGVPSDLETWAQFPFTSILELAEAQKNPAYSDLLRPAYREAVERKAAISDFGQESPRSRIPARQEFRFE